MEIVQAVVLKGVCINSWLWSIERINASIDLFGDWTKAEIYYTK